MLKMKTGATVTVEMGTRKTISNATGFRDGDLCRSDARISGLELDHWIRVTTKEGTTSSVAAARYSWRIPIRRRPFEHCRLSGKSVGSHAGECVAETSARKT